MYKKLLCVIFVLTAALNTSCSLFNKKAVVAQPDPNGSIDEKIAYHQNEIKVYRAAIEKEQDHTVKSLHKRNMSEVRRSNNKKAMYERKIKENQQAIIELKQQKRSMGTG